MGSADSFIRFGSVDDDEDDEEDKTRIQEAFFDILRQTDIKLASPKLLTLGH